MAWIVSVVNEPDNVIAEISDEKIRAGRWKDVRTAGGPRGPKGPLPAPDPAKRELVVDDRPLHEALKADGGLPLGRLVIIQDMVRAMDVNGYFDLDPTRGIEAITVKAKERREDEGLIIAEIEGAYGFEP